MLNYDKISQNYCENEEHLETKELNQLQSDLFRLIILNIKFIICHGGGWGASLSNEARKR